MDITVDTSVILAVILNGPTKPALLHLTEGADLRSAGSLPWEVTNALTALFKGRRLDLSQARKALESFEAIPIHLSDVDLTEAVSLGHEQGIHAFDAYILECARRYAAPLLSLDRAQCEVARKLRIDVLEVES